MVYRIISILHLLLTIAGIRAIAQHPFFYSVNDDNGLPSNEVYDLDQDEFGYMWIGSNAGLHRYDGIRFEKYSNSKQNAVAVSSLSFTKNKRLFCQNFFGQIFTVENDSLTIFADVKEHVRNHPEYTIDTKNNMWIGMPDGILKINNNGSKEYLFKDSIIVLEIESSPNGYIYAIDRKGQVWMISETGERRYSKTRISTPELSFPNNMCALRKRNDRIFLLASKNVGHSHLICEIKDTEIRTIAKLEGSSFAEYIYTVAYINNTIWVGTSSGAYLLNGNGTIRGRLFPKDKISDIFEDREGMLWFSTLQSGIFVIPHLELNVLNTANSGLTDNNITALRSLGRDALLAGTYTGDICKFLSKTGELTRLPKKTNELYRNVTTIIPYDENTIMAGRGVFSVINLKKNTEDRYPSSYIRDMAMVGDSIVIASTLSIGSIANLPRLIKEKKYAQRTIKPASGKRVSYDTAGKTVWVTLNEGLAYLDDGKFTPFLINGIPLFCNTLYSDKNGLWAGTVTDGVYNISERKPRLHLTTVNGIRGNNIKCITSYNDTLYIATDECINVRKPDGSYTYIKHADGINAKEINAISVDGNNIYIGTLRGLFYVPVSTDFRNNVKPNITISSVIIDGVKHPSSEKIKLNYNNKDILINFSAVALKSRGRFQYRYRILGSKDEWETQTPNINYVRLNHLPTGNFTFEIMAVNEDEVQSSVAKVNFFVAAPFWQKWWFYLVIVSVAALLVTLLFLQRITRIKKKAEIRNQLTNSQLTALKAQMNPHFMYNTLNSIQDLVLQNDIKNSNYYLSRYSSLMRKILDTSENNEIELAEEADTLRLYLELEQLRFGSDFNFNIEIDQKVDPHSTHIPSMIIQPFVENAIKHGLLHKKGKKTLSIIFKTEREVLHCTITDNGIGRERSAEIKKRSAQHHRSFATRATEKRLSLINENREKKIILKITDLYENGIASGTSVQLQIPLA